MITKKNTPYLATPESYDTVSPLFRRNFRLYGEVRRALLSVTAYGVYEATLNGHRVGDFILAPGWTSYHNRLQVQTYDVTAYLKKNNTLDLLLGEGWCCGKIAYDNRGTIWPRHPMATLRLDLTYSDGTKKTILPDRFWTVSPSPIRFSCIYKGETYDSETKELWKKATVIHRDSPNLIPQEGETLREIAKYNAVSVLRTPKGETVLDFGQEITGYVSFKIQAPKGSICIIDHFEVLDKDGNVYTESLRTASQRIHFVCDGTEQYYKPHFTYHGFRYIRLTEWPVAVNPDDFTAIVLCSDLRRTGSFVCSSPLVNRLYQNVIWGQLGNFLDVPTDCPQRDERLGWTGDAQVFCKTAAYNFDVERFFTKWLADLSADQFSDGSVPAVVPHVIGGKDWSGSTAWADAATICPWELYLAYGNPGILAKQFGSMKAWVDYIRSTGDTETLWNTGRHYGDHLALDNPQNLNVPATNRFLIATAYFAYSTSLLIKAGEILGKDMKEYRKLYRGILRSFNEAYIRDGAPITPTQTAYALCIHFDLVKNKKAFGNRLAELVRQNGNRLTTGFVGTAYLLQALSETGHTDVAYKLLLQEQFPSWLFSVRMGATTIWEHWDGIREDGSMWSASMNSFNHYAYGAVASWMYGYMAGIRPTEEAPGYKKFLLAPVIGEGIDFVCASFASRHGLIRSEWYRENGHVRYVFEVPMATTATVMIGTETFEIGVGIHEFIR